ncbi:MAG TPA: alpha/beta hydrolase [Vicinamibacterales bacterium]|nr:alpha/beta hydrolase [Vicinamibacterales bacterium]
MRTIRAALALVLLAVAVRAQPPAANARFETHANLTYYSGEGADKYRHRLDLYVPKGKKDFPVLMFVHGGGFTVGIKDQYAFVGQVFATYGIGTAVISYRLAPKTFYPENVLDTARAFVWLRQHAGEYGGKTDRIFISGHSAGATLIALLGSDPEYLKQVGESLDHVAGVIPISGSFTQAGRSAMFQGFPPPDAAVLKHASAINHVAGPHPPFLILYGDMDLPRTGEDARAMAKALTDAGNSAEVHEIAGHAHMDMITGVTDPEDRSLRFMLGFLAGRR